MMKRLALSMLLLLSLPCDGAEQAEAVVPEFRPMSRRLVSPTEVLQPVLLEQGVLVQPESAAVQEHPQDPPAVLRRPQPEDDVAAVLPVLNSEPQQPVEARRVDAESKSPVQAQPQTPERPVACPQPAVVMERPERVELLMVGDSVMEDFALEMFREVRDRRGYDVQVLSRRASCLSRTGRFRLAELLDTRLSQQKPHVVLLMMGVMDDQSIRTEEGYAVLGTPAWDVAYTARVEEVLAVLRRHGAEVIWVGLPAMGTSRAKVFRKISELTGTAVQRAGFCYVDTLPTLVDAQGSLRRLSTPEETDGRRLVLRQKDGKHLTRAGNRVLVRQVLPVLDACLERQRAVQPQRFPQVPEKGESLPVSLFNLEVVR